MRVFIVETYDKEQDRYFPIKVFPSTDKDENFSERLDKNISKFFEDIYMVIQTMQIFQSKDFLVLKKIDLPYTMFSII